MLIVGCAPKSYNLKKPEPSDFMYQGVDQSQTTMDFVDARPNSVKIFHSGVLDSTLNVDAKPIEPVMYLEKYSSAEFSARGLPVATGEGGGVTIYVNSFNMKNHRTSGFSPYISLTTLSADVRVNGSTKRVAAFVKRGKVPVWSFDEIIDPCLNEPMDIIVKEFVTKVSNELYSYQASDARANQLIERLHADQPSYIDVYQLAFTNNPKALPMLEKLAKDTSGEEYIRIAAISGLGIMKAVDQIPMLKDIYKNGSMWQDRAMALKAIGDMGTDASNAFLQEQLAFWKSQDEDKESRWNIEIINLYL